MKQPETLEAVRDLLEPDLPADPEEMQLRSTAIAKLCQHFRRDTTPESAEALLRATLEMPLYWLALTVRTVIRSRIYPTLPTSGDLWATGERLAGMHRQQYDAGRYLQPPRHWPPVGQRHSIHAGELEVVPAQQPRLAAIAQPPLLGAGND